MGRPTSIQWGSPSAGIVYAAAVGAAIPQSWFTPGKFVASGDSGPFLRGLRGVTRSWTNALSGSGSTGYHSAWLPEGLVHDIVTSLGLSDALAQRVWFTVVFMGCAAAVAWLAAGFTRHAAATCAAGVVAVVAPFHMTTLPNLLPAIAITAVALTSGWAIRAAGGRAVPAPAAVVLALVVAPLTKNPPLLVLVGAVMVGAGCVVVWLRRDAWRAVSSSAAWFAAGSLFWAVPLFVHFWYGTPGLDVVAQTDVDAWSWTQRNSGPANVVRLVASWVWGEPDVVGSVAGLSRGVWPTVGWALPLAVSGSVIAARNRRAAGLVAAAAAALVVLSVGINAPFGAINRFLYAHVPGFWLYRQPMSKFGVLLVVAYATLIAAGVDGLIHRSPSWRAPLRRMAGGTAAALMIAIVAFAHPMWTGSVIHGQRGGRNQLPPARVEVPAGWYRAGDWLDRAPRAGSVAVLPLSDYYQQGTRWGFYGVNDLVSTLTRRPAVNLMPGGYYQPAGSVPELLKALQGAIDGGDGAGTVRLMDSLGVAYVAIRTDLTTVPIRPTADAHALVSVADRLPELSRAATYDEVIVYEAATPARPTLRRPIAVRGDLDAERLADIVATAPSDAVVVTVTDEENAPASVAAADAWRPRDGQSSHEVTTKEGSYQLTSRIRGPLLWRATVVATPSGRPVVRIELASTLSVDGEDTFPPIGIEIREPGDAAGLVVGDRPLLLPGGSTLFEARPGTTIRVLTRFDSLELVDPAQGAVGNCNNAQGISLAQAAISAARSDDGVVLSAGRGSACLSVPVPSAPENLGARMWHIRGAFDRLSGDATRVCLWLPKHQRCAVGSPPITTEPSGTFDFLAASYAGEDPTGAALVIYADHASGTDDPAAVTAFDHVSISALTPSPQSVTLPEVQVPEVVRSYPDGAVARMTIGADLASNLLRPFPEKVNDCHNYDDGTAADNGLIATAEGSGADRVLELRAKRHSACLASRADVPAGVRHLSVAFDYRTLGPGGRWCLRASNASCVASARLDPSENWSTVAVDVIVDEDPLASAGTHKLYLYADGAGPGQPAKEATVQYRRMSVRATYPIVGVIQPLDAQRSEKVAVLPQAYAEGWRLTGPGTPTDSTHVLVDGWANGWLVPEGTDPTQKASFGPDRVVSTAVWTLPLILTAAVAALWARRHGITRAISKRRSSAA